MNERADYIRQRSFRSKVIAQTHRHTGLSALPEPLKWSVNVCLTYNSKDRVSYSISSHKLNVST